MHTNVMELQILTKWCIKKGAFELFFMLSLGFYIPFIRMCVTCDKSKFFFVRRSE